MTNLERIQNMSKEEFAGMMYTKLASCDNFCPMDEHCHPTNKYCCKAAINKWLDEEYKEKKKDENC